jgi:peptide/nickel transport system substrate-binding protein
VLAVVAATALGACGAAKKQSASSASHTLNIPFVADMSVPDPDIFYDVEGGAVTQSIYQGLVRYAPDSVKIAPNLATSWTVSADKKTYTFTLRQGVKFHDGATMTSADVKRSFERRQALKQGSGYMVAGVASMDTPDPQTFVVHLKTPQLPFMDYLASLWGPRVIGPDALVAHAGSDHSQKWLGTHADGTGPYTLAAFERGRQYVLQAFPGYWGANPWYTTVNVQITPDIGTQELRLRGGDLQMMLHAYPASDLAQARSNPDLRVALYPTGQTLIGYLNTHKAPFDSLATRQAAAKAIDLKTLVAQYGPTASLPAGPFPAGEVAGQPALGYGGGAPANAGKGAKILIQYAADEVATLGRVSQLLQVQLGKAGFDAKIQQIPHAQIYSYAQHPENGPDLILLTNNPDANHPDTWAAINYGATGGTNLLSHVDKTIDSLLAKARSAPDEASADALYRQVGQRIVASSADLILANVKDTIVYSKKLTGLSHVPNYPWMVDLATLKPAA